MEDVSSSTLKACLDQISKIKSERRLIGAEIVECPLCHGLDVLKYSCNYCSSKGTIKKRHYNTPESAGASLINSIRNQNDVQLSKSIEISSRPERL